MQIDGLNPAAWHPIKTHSVCVCVCDLTAASKNTGSMVLVC